MLPKAQNEWTMEEAAHLVRRAGFGGSPEEIRQIHALGREAAVEGLLSPNEGLDAFPVPEWTDPEAAAEARRKQMAERRSAMDEMSEMDAEAVAKAKNQLRKSRQQDSRAQLRQLSQWWFERITRSRAPLREKMTLFWHDHFATSARKVKRPLLMFRQNQLFRRQALGDFKALTHEILMDPAMMMYLDTPSSKKGKPNENFAREVMELFTLGEGNYGEDDIREAARAFTGYSVNQRTGEGTFSKRKWDDGTKTVFGKTGAFDGDDIIDILFEQPAAAEYVPRKLWAYFVSDEVPDVIVKELAETFRGSGFKLEPLLREIFLSRAFYDGTVMRNQIKSPIQFLVQMCRELELEGLPRGYASMAQQQLGQVLFVPPNVAGWDWGRAWINTNTLLNRYNIAGSITKGGFSADGVDPAPDMMLGDGKKPKLEQLLRRSLGRWEGPDYESIAPRDIREKPEELVDLLIERLFQANPGTKQRQSFIEYAKAKKGVVFTNHEVAELCHLMMSTPHYQLA